MQYLWIALIGLALGAISKLVTPGKNPRRRIDPGAVIVSMLVGLIGALFGGVIAHGLDISTYSDTSWFIAGIVGSIILLLLYNSVIGKRKTP